MSDVDPDVDDEITKSWSDALMVEPYLAPGSDDHGHVGFTAPGCVARWVFGSMSYRHRAFTGSVVAMGGQHRDTVELTADPAQVAVARRFVRHSLTAVAPGEVSADLELIVSELFTNAVEHGNAEAVVVTVGAGNGTADVTVDSSGPAPAVGPVESWKVATEDALTGRGLGIVRRLADRVSVERSGEHLVVTAYRLFGSASA